MSRTREVVLDGTGEVECHADGCPIRYCGRVYLTLARWDRQTWCDRRSAWITTESEYLVGRTMPMFGWTGDVSNWVQEARYTDEVSARQEYARLVAECAPAMSGDDFLAMVGCSTVAGAARAAHAI